MSASGSSSSRGRATKRSWRARTSGKALELLLTGAAIGADEALRIGLVNRVVRAADLMAEARKLAGDLAAGPPIALSYILNAVNHGLDMSTAPRRKARPTRRASLDSSPRPRTFASARRRSLRSVSQPSRAGRAGRAGAGRAGRKRPRLCRAEDRRIRGEA